MDLTLVLLVYRADILSSSLALPFIQELLDSASSPPLNLPIGHVFKIRVVFLEVGFSLILHLSFDPCLLSFRLFAANFWYEKNNSNRRITLRFSAFILSNTALFLSMGLMLIQSTIQAE